jgi:hypothetical protein
MKQALWLLAATGAALGFVAALFGAGGTAALAFGAVAAMAGLIALTFLWLWWVRATPLALGMALSWAGSALVAGWIWAAMLNDGLQEGGAVLFAALPLLLAGALLHFDVMRSSMGFRRGAVVLPVMVAFAAAAGALMITKA